MQWGTGNPNVSTTTSSPTPTAVSNPSSDDRAASGQESRAGRLYRCLSGTTVKFRDAALSFHPPVVKRSSVAPPLFALLVSVGSIACSAPEVATTSTGLTSTTSYSVIERSEAVVVCMREAGINAELGEPFGVRYPDRPEAEQVYNTCAEEIDRTMPFPVLSVEESYGAWLEAAECLRGLDIDVPPAPSLEVWREQGNERWDPYANVPLDFFGEIHEQCPQPGLGLVPRSP